MSGRFFFLPNVRSALVDAAKAPASGSGRRELGLRVRVLANASPVPESTLALPSVELRGAGDVVALDAAQIAVREPKPGSAGVEPNYFPYVEIVDADLPWRLSLDVGSATRRRPWLVLIALTADEFSELEPRGGSLPAIRVASPAASLPPLEQSWAYAHVQVQRSDSASFDIDRALRDRPETYFARIVCPRRLRDSTAYSLFLVPSFEAGRSSGLGLSAAPSPWNAPAWSAASGAPLDLPYYDRWSITTNTLEDIESLIRRLRPARLDAAGAPSLTRTIDASRPGHLPGFSDPGRRFEAEGALQLIGFQALRAAYADTPLTAPLAARLSLALGDERAANDGPDQEDPLVALPAWGAVHAGASEVVSPLQAPPRGVDWVNEANLDLRCRLAAGAGARTARRHQEDFARQAWEQVGDLQQANALRARLHWAQRLSARLVERHWRAMPAETALSLSEPLRHVARFGAGQATLNERLHRAGLPLGYASLALRRAAARRSAVRAIGALEGGRVPLMAVLPHVAGRAAQRSERAAVSRRAPALAAGLARTRQIAAFGRDIFPNLDAQARAALRPAAAPPSLRLELGTIDVPAARSALSQALLALPLLRGRAEILGLDAAEQDDLTPVRRGPRLVEPLSTYLAREEPQVFLPNAAELPDDSVFLLEENTRFVESFLAGANEEFRRELVYREYPFDQRASVFTRFWDRGSAADQADGDDVEPLDRWTGALGKNAGPAGEPRLVVLVRGELARRFPGFMLTLNRQVLGSGGWSAAAGNTLEPLFWGAFGEDMRYFGFSVSALQVKQHAAEHFFVVYEPPGRLRFGLDIQSWSRRMQRRSLRNSPFAFALQASSPQHFRGRDAHVRADSITALDPTPPIGGPATWDDLSFEHVRLTPSGYVDFDRAITIQSDPGDGAWGPQRTSASLARTMFQRPVRAVIPATRFL